MDSLPQVPISENTVNLHALAKTCIPTIYRLVHGYFNLGHSIDQVWTLESVDRLEPNLLHEVTTAEPKLHLVSETARLSAPLINRLPMARQLRKSELVMVCHTLQTSLFLDFCAFFEAHPDIPKIMEPNDLTAFVVKSVQLNLPGHIYGLRDIDQTISADLAFDGPILGPEEITTVVEKAVSKRAQMDAKNAGRNEVRAKQNEGSPKGKKRKISPTSSPSSSSSSSGKSPAKKAKTSPAGEEAPVTPTPVSAPAPAAPVVQAAPVRPVGPVQYAPITEDNPYYLPMLTAPADASTAAPVQMQPVVEEPVQMQPMEEESSTPVDDAKQMADFVELFGPLVETSEFEVTDAAADIPEVEDTTSAAVDVPMNMDNAITFGPDGSDFASVAPVDDSMVFEPQYTFDDGNDFFNEQESYPTGGQLSVGA